MRRTILAMLTIAFGFLYSCTNTNSTESTHSFAGTFITENGVRLNSVQTQPPSSLSLIQ